MWPGVGEGQGEGQGLLEAPVTNKQAVRPESFENNVHFYKGKPRVYREIVDKQWKLSLPSILRQLLLQICAF